MAESAAERKARTWAKEQVKPPELSESVVKKVKSGWLK